MRVVPTARSSEVVGVGADEHLRVRIAAPAVDGKANDELRRFMAEVFGVRRSAITIVRGDRSRTKLIHVTGPESPPKQLIDQLGPSA